MASVMVFWHRTQFDQSTHLEESGSYSAIREKIMTKTIRYKTTTMFMFHHTDKKIKIKIIEILVRPSTKALPFVILAF